MVSDGASVSLVQLTDKLEKLEAFKPRAKREQKLKLVKELIDGLVASKKLSKTFLNGAYRYAITNLGRKEVGEILG